MRSGSSKRNRIRVLITGGPTRAYLDPVRFLSNVSTGALAFHLCEKFLAAGIEVSAIIGPSSYPFEELGLTELSRIETTQEMYRTIMESCRRFRPKVAIFSAAVLDFEPAKRERTKVASTRSSWVLKLRPTPKIIDSVGKKFPEIQRIGFKLETKRRAGKSLEKFAMTYLRQKQLHGLCVNFSNQISEKAHHAYLFDTTGRRVSARSKDEIASRLLDLVTLRE